MQAASFQFPVRVYYEDTDAGGIVYNANYLKFLERARTEWLRAMGVEQDVWLQQSIAFVCSTPRYRFSPSGSLQSATSGDESDIRAQASIADFYSTN